MNYSRANWLFIVFMFIYLAGTGIAHHSMPPDWWQAPHNQDLSAFLAFFVYVAYLVFVETEGPKVLSVIAGILCGLTIAFLYSCGPIGYLISVGICAALGRFGIAWAA
jgi:hypothetical protein